ncbi:helix-turn-helix domain-containing protein [Cupriavidus metallidurans]|uniref:helix-turn-helix domain-containing protein n=2 Tax=Burkholderiaceae TaxID=119060 RepID=UPI0011402682
MAFQSGWCPTVSACPAQGIRMRTLDLQEAAAFLKMHPEEVRRRAKRGQIPGGKAGRAWVFIDQDLADYVRSLYAHPRQALQVTLGKEPDLCHFANVERSGGSTSSPPTANEYADLLRPKARPSRKSCTTS